MKKADVKIGGIYLAKVSGKVTRVRIDSAASFGGGWDDCPISCTSPDCPEDPAEGEGVGRVLPVEGPLVAAPESPTEAQARLLQECMPQRVYPGGGLVLGHVGRARSMEPVDSIIAVSRRNPATGPFEIKERKSRRPKAEGGDPSCRYDNWEETGCGTAAHFGRCLDCGVDLIWATGADPWRDVAEGSED